jgi:CDP-glucose 4,6-dehydratase
MSNERLGDMSFWRGKRVLVTGHTGFKGTWLGIWLQSAGADVLGYALPPPTQPSHYDLADGGKNLRTIIADVRDFDRLKSAVAEHSPEIVLHLAAQSVVRASYDDPRETYDVNVMGTVNVFEAARRVGGVRAIVNVTTDKVYENKEWLWGYREPDPLGGHDPYSNSKACSELVTSSFRDSFFPLTKFAKHGVAVASARAGNVIGGGDWTENQLIPDLVQAFSKGEAVDIRNPGATRPWQFVLEPLRGYLMLAEGLYRDGPRFSGGWNFGPPDEDAKPVQWLVEHLARLWGDATPWRHDAREHPHEAGFLKLDSSKAHAELGWKPRLRLSDALEWVVEWYKHLNQGGAVRAKTAEQIRTYERLKEP